MSTGRKAASVLAAGSLLAVAGLVAAPAASAADTGSAAQPAPAVVTGAGGDQLTSYDPGTGHAVLSTGNAPASQTASGSKPGGVKVGQVIDSLPSPATPKGALLVVTGVQKAEKGRVTVTTRPAAVSELLGSTTTSVHTAVSAPALDVTPQVSGLDVSYVPRWDGASASASAGLKLSADTELPLPDGTTAHLSGSEELDPTVDFDYQGSILGVQSARVGFHNTTKANWHVTGTFKATADFIKIPIASVSSSPVVWVGLVPVVVNLDLTLYAHISAGGTITVDLEQGYTDSWGVHADYSNWNWTTTVDPSTKTSSPLKGSVSGHGGVQTGLLTEGTIALFDSLGVKAGIEPYVRTQIDGSAVFDGSGGTSSTARILSLRAGLNINGALLARLKIAGTTLLEKDLPFTVYQNEWPLASTPLGTAGPAAAQN